MNPRTIGTLAAIGLPSTILAANWAIETFELVPVGFGLMAPAGVMFAGLALALRDIVHETLGRRAVLACIAVGAVLSLAVSPAFAVASAVAFTASELADLTVYEWLRSRGWVLAAAASNLVGLVVDSMLFLWIAFGSPFDHLAGQVVGKLWMGALGVGLVCATRAVMARRQEALV